MRNPPPLLNHPTSPFIEAGPPTTPDAPVQSLQSLLKELRRRQSVPGSEFSANMGSALEALWANRTRSFLTALGVFIGVAAVIAAVVLRQGGNALVTNPLAQVGSWIIL